MPALSDLNLNKQLYRESVSSDGDYYTPESLSGVVSSGSSSLSSETVPESITSGELLGNLIMVDGFIRSKGYIANTSGWTINADGSVEFDSGYFRGDITGASGTFSGTLTGGSLNIPDITTASSFHVDVSGNTWWGTNIATGYATAPAKILATGAATFTNVSITGGTVNWSTVAGTTNAPANNATVGADWSTNLSNIPNTLASPAGDGLYLSSTYLGYYKSSVWTSYIKNDGSFYFAGDAGSHIDWNVTTPATMTIAGALSTTTGSVIATTYLSGLVGLANTNVAAQGWTSTLVFSSTDYNTIAWAAGAFTTAGGTAYSIDAGNTGNMAATTYIYLDTAVSTTVLQTTTTAATANGSGKVLIAVAKPNTDTTSDASVQVFGGTGGEILFVDNIAANSASTNEFVSNTAQIANLIVTNAKINDLAVSKLTAGTITSQAITLAVSGGAGDVKIQAGKTDFGDTTNGFILGIDDSDSDTAKFEIGNSTKYLTWDGSTLDATGLAYNVVRLAGETIDTSSYPAPVFIAKESDTNIASGDIYSQTTTDNYLECYSSLYGTITQSFDVLTDVNYNINKITGVKLKFSKTGSPTGVMPIEIREAAGYGNSYQMTTIASGTIDPATFDGTETEYTITFSSAADIVPGRSYLVLIGKPSTSSNSSNYVRVYYTQNVNYNTGYMSGGADAANLTLFPNYSLYFKVVGERDVKTVIIDKVYNIDTAYTNSFQVDGLAVSSGDEDDNIKVRTEGICDGFTGLVSGRKYYYNTTTTYIPAQQTATNTSLILGQAGGSDYKKIGQTFKYIADSNYPTFYSIKVNLSKTGTPSDNVVCKLYKYNNSYTVPTALYTADNVIAGGSVTGSEAEYEFLFSDVALSDRQTYYLELTRSGDSDASNYFRVYYNSNNNLYQNGSLYYNSSGTTMDVQNYDMKFIVTYIPEDTIGYLSTAPNSTYEILVGNAISATEMEIIKTPSFKTRQTLTSGTIYYAYSDGWVTAYGSGATNTYENITGYTDSEPLPTTVAAKFSASTNVFGGISFPVKKGDYYKFVQSGDDTVLAYFNPNN